MQVGQEVRYFDSDDPEVLGRMAHVTAIVGAGASLAKRLDLSYRDDGKDQSAEDVPHEGDAEDGEHFWLMKGERRQARDAGEEAEDAPPELAVPEGARIAPAIEKKTRGKAR